MLGCDSNPSGPAAPINPAPGAGAGAPTTTPGVMPGGTVNNKKVDSPSPTAPNWSSLPLELSIPLGPVVILATGPSWI